MEGLHEPTASLDEAAAKEAVFDERTLKN